MASETTTIAAGTNYDPLATEILPPTGNDDFMLY